MAEESRVVAAVVWEEPCPDGSRACPTHALDALRCAEP